MNINQSAQNQAIAMILDEKRKVATLLRAGDYSKIEPYSTEIAKAINSSLSAFLPKDETSLSHDTGLMVGFGIICIPLVSYVHSFEEQHQIKNFILTHTLNSTVYELAYAYAKNDHNKVQQVIQRILIDSNN